MLPRGKKGNKTSAKPEFIFNKTDNKSGPTVGQKSKSKRAKDLDSLSFLNPIGMEEDDVEMKIPDIVTKDKANIPPFTPSKGALVLMAISEMHQNYFICNHTRNVKGYCRIDDDN